jgi:hypothetical protein
MWIGVGFWIVLVLLLVVPGVAVTLYRLCQRSFHAPLPRPFCDRDSQEAEWRERYDDEHLEIADAVLLLVCDAFCFNPEQRYKLQPDDQVMDVYRGCYPPAKKWPGADCMEMETLMFTFNKEFLTETSQWHAAITLGQLVELAAKQRTVKADSTAWKDNR